MPRDTFPGPFIVGSIIPKVVVFGLTPLSYHKQLSFSRISVPQPDLLAWARRYIALAFSVANQSLNLHARLEEGADIVKAGTKELRERRTDGSSDVCHPVAMDVKFHELGTRIA